MVLVGEKGRCGRDQHCIRMRLTQRIEPRAQALPGVNLHPVELQPGRSHQTLNAVHCEIDVSVGRITQHDDLRYSG